MTPDRITELLQPFLQAPPAVAEDILTYINILIRWNTRINLTAIRNAEEIVTRHFGESLFAARHLFPKPYPVPSSPESANDRRRNDQRLTTNDRLRPTTNDCTVADLGSGPGFPGLPIKLWAPHIALTLIESNHKKAAFLREITRSLTLMNVNIQNTRAETLLETTPHASFDVVTLRAVERFESALPTAAALVAPGGRLALLIGASQQDQAQASLSTFTWFPPEPIPQSTNRILLIATRP